MLHAGIMTDRGCLFHGSLHTPPASTTRSSGDGNSICKWSVNSAGMSSNPTDAISAMQGNFHLGIGNVFYSKGRAKEVSAGGMNDTVGTWLA